MGSLRSPEVPAVAPRAPGLPRATVTPAAVHVPLAARSPSDTVLTTVSFSLFQPASPTLPTHLFNYSWLLEAVEWFQPDPMARWKFLTCYSSTICMKINRERPSLVSPTRERLTYQPCLAHQLACHCPSSHGWLEIAKAACCAAGSELGTAWDAVWDDGGAGEGTRESRRLEMQCGMENNRETLTAWCTGGQQEQTLWWETLGTLTGWRSGPM